MTSGAGVWKLSGVNLLSTGTAVLIPQFIQIEAGAMAFLPQDCFVALRTLTGPALTTSPKIRVGGNATHDEIAPLFTIPLATQVDVVARLPLAAFPYTPVNLRSGPIFLEVQQAGIGPTACSGDILITGVAIS